MKHVECQKRKEAAEWAQKARKKVVMEQQQVETKKQLKEEKKRKQLVGQSTGRKKGRVI